ncbi:MAG TPA: 50S ribosomal protein L11 methyltransferase [Pyrinomonadaceae bacterium]
MSQVAVMDPRPSSARASENKRTLDMVANLLAKGEAHLEKQQFSDALDCFDLALCLDQNNQQAQLGRNRAHCQIIPRWHFEMLNDEQRNAAFQRALTNLITPDSIVLDIGSGTGLLAMMAAQAGAREIVTCEMVPQLAELTRDTIALNGLSERIITLAMKSTSLVIGYQMLHKANLLVTETVDCGLLGEGIASSIAHAKVNLLTEDAQIVPCAATVYAMVVESPRLRNLNYARTAAGFDVSLANRFTTANYFPVRLAAFEYTALTDPFEVFHFDFANETIVAEQKTIEVPAKRDGAGQCIIFWFNMQLDAENAISNEPGSTTHWEQALQCLDTETSVRAGDTLRVHAEHDCHLIRFTLD